MAPARSMRALLYVGGSPLTREAMRVALARFGLQVTEAPSGPQAVERLRRTDVEPEDLARHVPGLAATVAGWLTDAPHVWGPLVGPATREVIDELTGAAVPV